MLRFRLIFSLLFWTALIHAGHCQGPSIDGLQLGWTRAQVEHSRGEPSSAEAHWEVEQFTVVSYGLSEVVYDGNDKVVGLSGREVQWEGKKLGPGVPERVVRRHFPSAVITHRAGYAPHDSHTYYVPTLRLTLEMDGNPFHDEAVRLDKVNLSVPFLGARRYWNRFSKGRDLLTRTARQSYQNREALEKSPLIGCYFCAELLVKPPSYTQDSETGSCPACLHPALLAGDKSTLTEEYLRTVQRVWLHPRTMAE